MPRVASFAPSTIRVSAGSRSARVAVSGSMSATTRAARSRGHTLSAHIERTRREGRWPLSQLPARPASKHRLPASLPRPWFCQLQPRPPLKTLLRIVWTVLTFLQPRSFSFLIFCQRTLVTGTPTGFHFPGAPTVELRWA